MSHFIELRFWAKFQMNRNKAIVNVYTNSTILTITSKIKNINNFLYIYNIVLYTFNLKNIAMQCQLESIHFHYDQMELKYIVRN